MATEIGKKDGAVKKAFLTEYYKIEKYTNYPSLFITSREKNKKVNPTH